MAEIRKTNIFQYLKTKYNNVASIVKMNGTQSAGSSDYIARADHVHPTDTSRAASNHSHGSLVNDGALNSDITSVNKVAVTDATNKLKTISKLPLDKVTHQDISGKANVNHSHDSATVSVNGFLSKEDKSKLDGIATEANKTVVDSSLSGSSTNPVQNKVVNSALSGKANSSHSHSISNITNLQSALNSKSATGHNHDDRYYTETEMDKKLNGKADSNHTHDYIPSTVSQNVFGSGDSKVTATRQGNVVTLRLHFIGDFAETWKQWCTITDPQYLPDTDEEFTDFGITSSYGRHMLLRINSDGRVRTGYGGNVNTSSYQTITFLKK